MLTAMILAAGRGERLRPLTDHTPKPLITIQGRSLICRHLDQLERLTSIKKVVINHAWLGEKLESSIKKEWGKHSLTIEFSPEHQLGLETGGGILKALPLLSDPFIVINGDIFTELDFAYLVSLAQTLSSQILGKLILVPNPKHHPNGDFSLCEGLVSLNTDKPTYTYSGMSILRHALFDGLIPNQPLALGKEIFRTAILRKQMEGIVTNTFWEDVGTIDRLAMLRERYEDYTPITQV
jgi:N-acetyl-alpha-D-muramate 1-phosphate uridylyltransferase